MSHFLFHLSKSIIDVLQSDFSGRHMQFSVSCVSSVALSTSPFLGLQLFGLRD